MNACRRHFGPDYTAGGKDCGEYPFATTYEGAAGSLYDPEQLRNNFSVMALDSTQNQAAGTLLGQFLTTSRLIDGPDGRLGGPGPSPRMRGAPRSRWPVRTRCGIPLTTCRS
ncbi:NucA/NucB deoxyribonuclease domain-containing protein [Streptomyces niveus]